MVASFKEICDKTAPVMRHYFTEKHKSPIAWFAMRLNYIRSVATTSIVGHVLGLGDRHVSNILLDNGTGEVVHIDLGIAFDQVRAPCTLASIPCISYYIAPPPGKAIASSGTCPVPDDARHGGRNGLLRHPRRIPAMCRRNPARSPRAVRCHHDRARSLQA